MVGSCLVLAPDVNHFLNSRKLGISRWRSLFLVHCLPCGWKRFVDEKALCIVHLHIPAWRAQYYLNVSK